MTEKWVERIDAVFLPVHDLEESLAWYMDIFGFPLRWRNSRMAGLSIAPNCGFHLVKVEDYVPLKGYTPLNFVVKDVAAAREKLLERRVTVSEIREDDTPVRFDFIDPSGNAISVIRG
ncbi:VOC family protein [Paenibacillus filicis]|uniref:VOC family protein n=1 Tax=Paenibacillus gyeongsangnamensis TaxID=3388067 RepID=A0ABT4QCH3_9BACL|nr:VOC family protein [Paenibacillus filicis]MCZ8514579.1 VOC family protein [Paenibacillus filicis]